MNIMLILISIFLGFTTGMLLGVAAKKGIWKLYATNMLDLLALQEEYFHAMLYSEEPKYRTVMKEHMANLISQMHIKHNKMKAIWDVKKS